ncbi:MAG: DNA (cytosine-5-)-methyltransferase [Clostridia bacterium]|nr:DNA (cytosine-5-)-methyltransferase [Clostridia bacterium]
MKYKTIDLCAGIGGIRRGFELTGAFENVLSAEIDDAACATYEHLFGDNPKNDLTLEDFKETVSNTEYDVLLAGFPCQTFSRAGLQLGFRDTTKGTIFFDIADIISRTNPRAVFLENVENLVSHDNGKTLKRIVKTLEDELKYRIIGVKINEDGEYVYSRNSLVRNSRFFGLPQNRPRVYLMAFSKEFFGNSIKLLSDELPKKSEKVIAGDLNDILETNVDDFYYMSSGYLETLKKHKVREQSKGHGFGYIVVNEDGIKHPVANTILATGGSGKERNLIRQPKEGVSGKLVPTKKTALNSEGIRVMTPTEWGRLQGFIGYAFIDKNGEDNFSFPDGATRAQQYKQFGNSVTIPVIETMANFMLKCFKIMGDSQIAAIVQMAKKADCITRRDVIEQLGITPNRATYLLKKAKQQGLIELCVSKGRYAKYVRKAN